MATTAFHTESLKKLSYSLLAGLLTAFYSVTALAVAPPYTYCDSGEIHTPYGLFDVGSIQNCDDNVVLPGGTTTVSLPLDVSKSCFIEPPPTGEFACSKPISEISMIWNGVSGVGVKAYKGNTGAELLATIFNVQNGQEVTVSGYAGSPNDVTWEVFNPGGAPDVLGTFMGVSVFHLSCSDDDMDGETDDPDFPQDCGKPEGDGKGTNSNRINDWLLEGMVDSVGTLNCTPDTSTAGGDPVTECAFTRTGGECTQRPTSISFRYHAGDNCDHNSNNQDSGKWSCTPYAVTPVEAHIIVSKSDGSNIITSVDVNATDNVVVANKGSSYDSEILILVNNTDNNTVQEIEMHSSCSQELKIGDRFGAMEVVGFTNSEQGEVGGSMEVMYDYSITNNSVFKLMVVSCDDKLDASGHYPIPPTLPGFRGIPGAIELLAGADPFIHSETALLDATTTNTLTSIVYADLYPICKREAFATVTLVEPPPPQCSVAPVEYKISKDKLEWKMTNTGDIGAVIESIDLTWPAGNGALDKVKRDGDEIVSDDIDETLSPVTITTFKGNADKRTIKVGDTDTVKFEFKDDADTDAGNYAITVNFEGCDPVIFP